MKEYAGLGRSLRAKRKTYIDGMSSSDEETENIERTLDPEDIVASKNYPAYFIKEMQGDEVTLEHFQKTGLKNPIFVREKTGLHMKIPDPTFTITDVRNLVGGKRILEVMNCATQSNAEMTLKDWEEFFTAPDRDDTKLNVISLEFSHTKLDSYVVAPRVVRQVDFTDNVWPRHLKEMQEDTTNDMSRMLYPKVQKYCLMSIAGCYTDFHVDLGGTSVWYHVLRGKKVFWLVQLGDPNLPLCSTLTSLTISSCKSVTDLTHLARCTNLYQLNFTETGVSYEATMQFMSQMPHLFLYREGIVAKHK